MQIRRMLPLALIVALISGCGGEEPSGPGEDTSSSPDVGAVSVTTFSTGTTLDQDGFRGNVAGQDFSLGTSETAVVGDITAGSHDVELADIAPNCDLSGDNPRTVQVSDGDTTSVQFELSCPRAVIGKMLVVEGGTDSHHVITANPDGSQAGTLLDLPNYSSFLDFSLSADGTVIVFTMADSTFAFHTYVEDLTDGQDPQEVSWTAPVPDFAPSGRRIAYSSNGRVVVRDLSTDSTRDVTDDGGLDQRPKWIDSENLLFDTDRGQTDTIIDRNLYRVKAETRSLTVVDTSDRDTYAEDVSPDGTQTVASLDPDTLNNDRLYTLPIDGAGRTKITSDTADTQHLDPAYSPDGSWIYYVRNYPGGTEQIRRVAPDGSSEEVLLEGGSYLAVLVSPEP